MFRVINTQRMRRRITVLGLSVRPSVRTHDVSTAANNGRHQLHYRGKLSILNCFLLKRLHSRDMASFVYHDSVYVLTLCL